MPISLHTTPHPDPSVVSQIVETEAVLVQPARGKVKVLNEAGARIWALMDGQRCIQDIAAVLAQEYDIPPETACTDALAFVEDLFIRGLVTLKDA